MNIKKLIFPKKGPCGYCGREKIECYDGTIKDIILRYEVKLSKTKFYMCTACFEEQMEFAGESNPAPAVVTSH